MQRFISVAIVAFLITIPANGQTSITAGGEVLAPTSDSPAKLINLYPTHQFSGNWGGWLFAGITPQWAEMLAGPLYSRSFSGSDGFVQAGVGAGFEQPFFSMRFAGSVFLKYQKLTFFGFIEYSKPSGSWHQAILLYQLNHGRVGLMSQGLRGVGPRVEFDVSQTPVTFWCAYVNRDSWKPLVGVKIGL